MTPWQERAACAGADTELFFMPGEMGRGDKLKPPPDPHAAARGYCNRCPVITECRDWATTTRLDGFAGGMTADERKAARRRKTRGTEPSRDTETTRMQAYREGMNDVEIGDAVGRKATTIRDWRKARDLKPNAVGRTTVPEWRLALYESMWVSGLTDLQIAEGTRTTRNAVQHWRRRTGRAANTRPVAVNA